MRTGGTQPDEEGLKGISADVYRPKRTDNRYFVSGPEGTDILRVRLSKAAPQAAKLTLTADTESIEVYNKENGTDFQPFPAQNVTLLYNKEIATGAKESDDIAVNIERGAAGKGRYLLPITAEITGLSGEVRTLTYYYVVHVLEPAEEGQTDPWDFKVVAYVNTEEMQPIIAVKYSIDYINQLT